MRGLSFCGAMTLFMAACGPGEAPVDDSFVLPNPATLDEVIDGDTLSVLPSGATSASRLRLKGIDAPELFSDPPEAFAAEARAELFDASTFRLGLVFEAACSDDGVDPFVACRDGFDRLLAYVLTVDGVDLNERLVERGLARVFRFQGEGYDRLERYEAAQSRAQAAGLGIWAN